MTEEEKIELVKAAIKKLYTIDQELIERDLCERCLVHRLAVHLGNDLFLKDYIIDCEFNRAFEEQENTLKRLSSEKGNYVDIIVHKRSNTPGENLMCLEVKRAKNGKDRNKDRENLKILTEPRHFGYILGFYVILGKSYDTTRLELYSQGHFVRQIQIE